MPVRLEDLPSVIQASVRVGRLERHARALAAAGDPGAPEAEAAAVAERLAGERAGLLRRLIELSDLRDRHAEILPPDAQIEVGVGWQPLVEEALERLRGRHVVVTLIREKFAGLDLKVWPRDSWRPDDFEAVPAALAPAREAALRTCEVCGVPGSVRKDGRWRTRCDAHVDVG